MASPQVEEGYLKIANELMDAYVKMRVPGEAGQLFWCIVRKTYGWKKKADRISYSQFSEATGIISQHIYRNIQILLKMNMILKCDGVYSVQKDHDKWIPLPKKPTPKKVKKTPKKVSAYTIEGVNPTPSTVVTKDNKDTITKDNKPDGFFSTPEIREAVEQVGKVLHTKSARSIFFKLINKYKPGYVMFCLLRMKQNKGVRDHIGYFMDMLSRGNMAGLQCEGGDDLVFREEYTARDWLDLLQGRSRASPLARKSGSDELESLGSAIGRL